MDTSQRGRAASDVATAVFGIGCFATIAAMTLTEQFEDLASAALAFASGWCILRLNPHPDR